MNLYQRAYQIWHLLGFRRQTVSGNHKQFKKAYRKGDISEEDLFKVVCHEAYPSSGSFEEDNLVLLDIDKKGTFSFFAGLMNDPTPIFFREKEGDEDIIFFHPLRMNWEKSGKISEKKRLKRLEEISSFLN